MPAPGNLLCTTQTLNHESSQNSPSYQQAWMVRARDKVLHHLVLGFDEATNIISDLANRKDFKPRCTLDVEVSREEHEKISSESLPNLKEHAISLRNALDPTNLLGTCADDSSWDSIFDLSILISSSIAKLNNSYKPVERRGNWEALKNPKESDSIIKVPARKYSSSAYTIEKVLVIWESLLGSYKIYIKTFRRIPERVLPNQFWPELSSYSNFFLKSIDEATKKLVESDCEFILELFRARLSAFNNNIESHQKTLISFSGEDDDPEKEERRVFLKTWIGVLVLFRLLLKKLSSPHRHSFGVFFRLSYHQLEMLEGEFDKWTEWFWAYFNYGWRIGDDTEDSAQRMLESLKVIRDLLVLEKAAELRTKGQRENTYDFSRKHDIDRLNSQFSELRGGVKIDQSKKDDKVWIETWLAQASAAIQKSFISLFEYNQKFPS